MGDVQVQVFVTGNFCNSLHTKLYTEYNYIFVHVYNLYRYKCRGVGSVCMCVCVGGGVVRGLSLKGDYYSILILYM